MAEGIQRSEILSLLVERRQISLISLDDRLLHQICFLMRVLPGWLPNCSVIRVWVELVCRRTGPAYHSAYSPTKFVTWFFCGVEIGRASDTEEELSLGFPVVATDCFQER